MSNRKLTSPHCPHCGKPIAAPRKPAATGGMTAEQFFDARNIACANAGPNWHLHADTSAWFTIPNKLRSFKTARGTTIKCHRDGRLPAARYWPNGTLPAGLEPAAPSTLSPADLHRGYAARCAEWRNTARDLAMVAFRARRRGEFARWKHDARQHETARLTALSYAEHPPIIASHTYAQLANAFTRKPEPVAEPAPVTVPAPVAVPVPAAPVSAPSDPALAAVWQTAVTSWRAYQSPADGAALAQCQDAAATLLAALRDRGAHADHMLRAFKAGRAFPAHWFRSAT